MPILLALLLGVFGSPSFAQSQWLSPDFSLSPAPAGWHPRRPLAKGLDDDQLRAACGERMKKTLCVNDWTAEQLSSGWDQAPCASDSDKYVGQAMSLYDEMPARIRPLFCSLEKIFLSDQITSVAFASSIGGWSGTRGAFVGARLSSFVKAPSASSLVSWKEQLLYGGSSEFLSNDPSLVQVHYSLKLDQPGGDALFYVLMHELGHVVDFQNGVNAGRKYGWSALSWGFLGGPTEQASYYDQDKVCYYDCSGPRLPASEALKIYTSLAQSSFITTYSGVNSWEDFAEFWAWNIMRQYKQGHYAIEVPGQGTVDMESAFTQNPKIKAKLDLVNQILQSPTTKVGF